VVNGKPVFGGILEIPAKGKTGIVASSRDFHVPIQDFHVPILIWIVKWLIVQFVKFSGV
jgi:hypothetical protein